MKPKPMRKQADTTKKLKKKLAARKKYLEAIGGN